LTFVAIGGKIKVSLTCSGEFFKNVLPKNYSREGREKMKEVKFKNGMSYQKGGLIFSKKAKAFYEVVGHPELAIMKHLNVVASDDGKKSMEIAGKGLLNSTINDMLFELLRGQYTDHYGTTPIKTHYIAMSADDQTECLIKWAEQVIALEVIVRNQAYGSFSKRYGVPEGTKLSRPTCEFTLKDDALNDPLINEDHIQVLNIATDLELQHMREVALAVNRVMIAFFNEISIDLIDFKLVFGRLHKIAAGDPTNLRLIGEISPDTCRLRDQKTQKCLDKDIFRHGLAGLSEAYSSVSDKMIAYRKQCNRSYGIGSYDENGNALK